MKLPPAMDIKITLMKSDIPLSKMPVTVPKGVAEENISMNCTNLLKGILLFYMAIEMEMASAALWIMIETARLTVSLRPANSPKAIPSKMACTERAIIRTIGVRSHLCLWASLLTMDMRDTNCSGRDR